MNRLKILVLVVTVAVMVLAISLLAGYRNEEYLVDLIVNGVVTDQDGQGLGGVSVHFIDVDLHETRAAARPEEFVGMSDAKGQVIGQFHYRYGNASFFGISFGHDTFTLELRKRGCPERTLLFRLSDIERTAQGYLVPFRATMGCD